jgi:hypothetical protein
VLTRDISTRVAVAAMRASCRELVGVKPATALEAVLPP